MLTVRRVYLYLVAAISLTAVTWAVIGLVRLILTEGIGQGQITGLATMLATIIVGLPIFLFHWLIAQRLANDSVDERESPVRQLFFYGMLAIGATPIWANIYRLFEKALIWLVGGEIPDTLYPYDLTLAEHATAILIWGTICFYLWRLIRGQAHRYQTTIALINRGIWRLYLLGFTMAGLVMVTWGAFGVIQTLMQSADGILWDTLIAGFVAQLTVGTVIWLSHWLILQRAFWRGEPFEERSVLRKIYLYLLVFLFSLLALSSGTLLLKRFLELILGAPPASEPLLTQLSFPVPLLILGTVFWAYHWSVLNHEAAQTPELPRQAQVRRVYAYLVAGVGLAVLLTGLVGLLSLIIDLVTSQVAAGYDTLREQVALFIAMTLVSTPVWLLPWRAVQRRIEQVRVSDTAPDPIVTAEYRSLVRKIYLYGFVFIASLGIFGSAGWFVYHLLTALLGADLPDDFMTLVLKAFVIGLLALLVWLYHWWILRRDGDLEARNEASRLANISVVVLDGDGGQLGQTLVRQLKQDLPGLQLMPVGVSPEAVTAMDGQPVSNSTLESAQYIVGSWRAFSAAPIAPILATSRATKFVIPTAVEPNWHWAGVRRQSSDEYARQVALGLKQALKGEDVDFVSGADTGTVITVVIGILLFLCLGGSLISLIGGVL
ncbi:MAG TPA: DUF5671 domain-containing protein [Anaerolineae bacterium]|nr:DUF5671 domain-containing protein [Anaerolineae bacterium]HMR63470.1 DUF5671 domain-containing protein [Anaerolineae bacterium]